MSRSEFLRFIGVAAASVIGLVGVLEELNSRAATATVSIEPENGARDGNAASVVIDSSASNGKAIKFQAIIPPPSGVIPPTPGATGASGTVGVIPGVPRTNLTMTGPITATSQVYKDHLVNGVAVFQDLTINGVCDVQVPNASFSNCYISCNPGGYKYGNAGKNVAAGLIVVRHSSNVRITATNCTFENTTHPNVSMDGMIGSRYTATSCDAFGVTDGFGAYSTRSDNVCDVTIDNCFVHDLIRLPDPDHPNADGSPGPSHCDGVQMQGGSGFVLKRSSILGSMDLSRSMSGTGVNSASSSLNLLPNVGAVTEPNVQDCVFDYGDTAIVLIWGSVNGTFLRNALGKNSADARYIMRIPPTASKGWPTQTFTDDLTTNFRATVDEATGKITAKGVNLTRATGSSTGGAYYG